MGITTVTQEQLELVTTPYPAGAPCGCTQDDELPPDANLDMTAQVTNFTLVTDIFDDPFVADFIFETTGATYTPNEPVLFRACTSQPIDPESRLTLLERRSGLSHDCEPPARGSTFVLDPIDGSEQVTCELTDFEVLN